MGLAARQLPDDAWVSRLASDSCTNGDRNFLSTRC